MPMRILIAIVAWVLLATTLDAQAPTEKGRLGLSLTEVTKPWTGDLDGMMERRMVRVLTAYSRTLYFVDSGTPRGTAYDQGKLLEERLNKTLKSSQAIRVQFIPLSRDELLPALLEGKGDIVMANLTVTPERSAIVGSMDRWRRGNRRRTTRRPGDHGGRRPLRQTGVRAEVEQLLRKPRDAQ
jgi:ABC-type amino acid transport substrate-binding protein